MGSAHDLQALVVMLCALISCPLPCGIPLNMLLEIMNYIYEPPPPPEETLPSLHSATSQNAGSASPPSHCVDDFSSPPLLKRSTASPSRSASMAPESKILQDVSRVLPFGDEVACSEAAGATRKSLRSARFLIIAACIKPILATTFVSATPSLSLAGAHVRSVFSLLQRLMCA